MKSNSENRLGADSETLIKRKSITQLIQEFWLLLFFGIVLLFMAVFKISPRDVWIAISILEIGQLLFLLFLYLLISFFLIMARKYLLNALLSPAKLKNLIFIHFSTMAAHYATPAKIGFPLAVYLLKKYDEVPYASGTTMILIELFVSIAVCGVIAFVGSFQYFAGNTTSLFLSLFYLLVIILLVFFGTRLFLKKGNTESHTYRFTKNVIQALSQITILRFFGYTLIITFIQFLGGFVLVLLSHFLSEELSLWQATTANSAAFFLGAISMIPMGLGIREASVLIYLKHVGIPNEIGISIVTVQRLFSTGLSFLLGIIFGAILGLRNIDHDSHTKS